MKTRKSIYHLNFVYVLLVAVIFYGCNEVNTLKKNSGFVVRADSNPLTIVEVDSCEYLLGEWGNASVLTHKGNCKFCAERSKKQFKNK